MSFHSGFVCILGRPNAGKSTLLNALVGEKLAIISPKPQTTRNRILGIINVPKQKGREAGQIVLIDTPGVHQSGSSLGRKMMSEVREALEGCELILMIVDAKKKWDREDAFVLDLAKKAGTPVFLLLNKIDLLADKSKLLPLIAQFQTLHDFKEIVPISALKKKGPRRIAVMRPEGSAQRPTLFSRRSDYRSAGAIHGGGVDPRACSYADA